jgi:hypothetical protein
VLNSCQAAIRFSDNNGGPAGEQFDSGWCIGWVTGALQLSKLHNEWINLSKQKSALLQFCLPDSGIPVIQAVRVVVKYLKEHPEQLHDDGMGLTVVALKESFRASESSLSPSQLAAAIRFQCRCPQTLLRPSLQPADMTRAKFGSLTAHNQMIFCQILRPSAIILRQNEVVHRASNHALGSAATLFASKFSGDACGKLKADTHRCKSGSKVDLLPNQMLAQIGERMRRLNK